MSLCFPCWMFCTSTFSTSCSSCSMSNMAVCWYFLDVVLSRYVARFYLFIYLSIWDELPGILIARGRSFHERGYFKEAVAKLMLGAVRQCLYSKSGASLSRIGQSAPGGLLYQGPPSKLRGTTKNLSTVVEQLLITHRIRYTRCRGKLPSGYTLFCQGVQQRSSNARASPGMRIGTFLVALIAN